MDIVTAQTHLDAWLAADLALATAKSYTIGNRQLTRADVGEIRDQIAYWQNQVSNQTAIAAGISNPSIAIADFSQ
jgi:hypothetical protein